MSSKTIVDAIFEQKRRPEVELQRLIGLEDGAVQKGNKAKASEYAAKIKAHAKKHKLRVLKPD